MIHISNLPFSVDKNQLKDAFSEFGTIVHANVSLDERKHSRGIGFVGFTTRQAALEAAKVMDKAQFNKREVNVKFYDDEDEDEAHCKQRGNNKSHSEAHSDKRK